MPAISYSGVRRPDPRIHRLVDAALGNAKSVVNIGAGTGNYEPSNRDVLAVEPSPDRPKEFRGRAGDKGGGRSAALPCPAFDAVLAILTLHHWTDLAEGLSELRRVAKRQVILTSNPGFPGNSGWSSIFLSASICPRRKGRQPLTNYALTGYSDRDARSHPGRLRRWIRRSVLAQARFIPGPLGPCRNFEPRPAAARSG